MKKIKDNRRGSTLVEVIVTFALIGMFLLAATTAVSAAMNAFYRMESLSRAIVVSDTILDKAQGELSLASADGALLCLGGGTDVAKDAAAMVLTDDNFATIVNAIEIGRTVYSNIKKSITYLLAGNLAAIIAIVFAVVINWENPFTTLQLLFINLINDSLPAIALAFEVAEPNTMNKPPRDINEGILQGGTSSVILIRGIIISIVVIIAQYLGNKTSPILGAAMAFSTITLSRIFQTLPARSDNISVFNIGVAKNKYVLGAIGICLLLYLIVLLPGLRAIFSIPNYFGVMEFAICILLALISTVLMELVKIFKK